MLEFCDPLPMLEHTELTEGETREWGSERERNKGKNMGGGGRDKGRRLITEEG